MYELEVVLEGTDPPIWRRLRVDPGTALDKLHLILQAAMGWENKHPHCFRQEDALFAPAKLALEGAADETIALKELLRRPGDALAYEYDFESCWEHRIELLAVRPSGARECLGGERACPPEDCGGVDGYEELLDIIADPDHEDYEETMEWLDDSFESEEFDVMLANRRLRRVP